MPDWTGSVDRAGVEIHFEVFNRSAPTTVLLVAPSPITHSRIWKAQIPHLARQYRVVTFDGRGNGRSGRPTAIEDHTRAANVADIIAVLDATDTSAAVVVGHCHANWWVVDLLSTFPTRVEAFVAISPGVPYLGTPQPHWASASSTWDTIFPEPDGWELFNRHVITNEHRRWVEFFFGEQLVEPHSTKQLEDAIAWSLESTGEILAASEEAQELELPDRAAFEEQCRSISVPTLVVHGDRDVCQHVDKGRAFAELVGGELVVLEGAGHLALVRDPVPVNLAITNFIDRTISAAPRRRRVWTRAASRCRRVLYLSSPIGLGHVRRDLAIADELRRLSPDLEIDWLAQDPVTAALLAAGETIHPASDWLSSESAHIASESCGHDLHCFQALRSMDEILVANFMLFQEV
ncbi:MAG TPA: alpha/beta fold hydrolase, partial [Ilumatobacteraceae bacterium]